MSLTSMRRRVLDSIVARLQAITANNVDFETDAGQLVYVGEPQALGESDPAQAIAIVIGEDEPQSQTAGALLVTTPFEICALAQVAPEDPWTPVEAVLADIKRAMEPPCPPGKHCRTLRAIQQNVTVTAARGGKAGMKILCHRPRPTHRTGRWQQGVYTPHPS